jgi:hypothetical protein
VQEASVRLLRMNRGSRRRRKVVMGRVSLEVEKRNSDCCYLNAAEKSIVYSPVDGIAVFVGPGRRIFVWQ